jgi:hypothetical protein
MSGGGSGGAAGGQKERQRHGADQPMTAILVSGLHRTVLTARLPKGLPNASNARNLRQLPAVSAVGGPVAAHSVAGRSGTPNLGQAVGLEPELNVNGPIWSQL